MFQLDDNFLQETGLAALPEEQRQYRVGVRLSDGMTDDQLKEFEAIIDRREEAVNQWVLNYAPAYQTDELFMRMQQASGFEPTDFRLVAEYASTKWLEINRPDYREVVSSTLGELKQEIIQSKDAILGNPA